MTILAQSLLTLVSSHLVALLFLSVWHSFLKYYYLCDLFVVLFAVIVLLLIHAFYETLCWFECWQVMCFDNQCCIL